MNKRDSILDPKASEEDDLSTQPPDPGIPYLVYNVLGLLNFIEKYEMRPGGKKNLSHKQYWAAQAIKLRPFVHRKKEIFAVPRLQSYSKCYTVFFPFCVQHTALALLKSHALGHFQSYRESLHKQ